MSTTVLTPPVTASSEPCSVSELIERARQNPLRWLVRDVVLEEGVHILHGHEESFKTMLTLQLHESLANGSDFLLWRPDNRLRTGIAELETKHRLFEHRLDNFFRDRSAPDIRVLPEGKRQQVISLPKPKDRIEVIAEWAASERLQFVSIDSAVKLFPPGYDLSKPELASEVFNQLQHLPTTWIIAHNRKPLAGTVANAGNAEIVGSGRFAQDPDIVHEMIRSDRRAPVADFSCGKVREGQKFDSVPLFFDHVDFRLYPLHPYLHFLSQRPMLAADVLSEASRRYGWQERRARDYLASLNDVLDANGNPCIRESREGHNKQYTLIGIPHHLKAPEPNATLQ